LAGCRSFSEPDLSTPLYNSNILWWEYLNNGAKLYKKSIQSEFFEFFFKKPRYYNRGTNAIERVTVNVAGLSYPVSLIGAYNE